MHNPGICGVILASSSQFAGDVRSKTKTEAVSELITALNADTEMVLVALGADSETLAPVAWARAAYVVQLPPRVSEAETLRTMLQEVLNHGRDAALVVALDDTELTAEMVHKMVTAYCSAGDGTWAVVTKNGMSGGHPALLGREMIELFLRGQKWTATAEVFSANSQHVSAVEVVASAPAHSVEPAQPPRT